MNVIHTTKNGKYYAQTLKAKLKFPVGKNTSPYGLCVLDKTKSESDAIMDLSAFRPDIRDYVKGISNIEIVVLYETAKYTGENSMFPRYILYEDTLFTNVRNARKDAK